MPARLAGLSRRSGPARCADTRTATRVVQDRVLSVDVDAVALCAHLRLAAILLNSTTVSVQRLTWQRLATLPHAPSRSAKDSAPVDPFGRTVALAWSPPGAGAGSLALASDAPQNHLRVAPVEAQPSALRQIKLPATASTLQWVDLPCPTQEYDTRMPTTAGSGSVLGGHSSGVGPGSTDSSEAGMLAVGDCDGQLTLLSYNLDVKLGVVRVLPRGVAVRALFFAPDLTRCIAVGRGRDDRRLMMKSVSLRPIMDSRSELRRAGAEHVAVSAMLKEIEHVVDVLAKSWMDEAMGDLQKKIYIPLEKLLIDFAEDGRGGPWETLRNAFCGVGIQGALEQFLGSEVGENGAKELLRSFSAASDEVQEAVRYALPVVEQFMFRASEYRGLARLKNRFLPIGLPVALVDQVFTLCEHILELLGLLALELEVAAQDVSAFLRWIRIAAFQASGTEQRASTIGPEVLGRPNEVDSERIMRFFEIAASSPGQSRPYATAVDDLYRRLGDKTLQELCVACKDMLDAPTIAMSNALAVLAGAEVDCDVPLYFSPNPSTISFGADVTTGNVEAVYHMGDDRILIASNSISPDGDGYGAWCVGMVRVLLPQRYRLRAATHAGGGCLCVVASAPVSSAAVKESFSMHFVSIPEGIAFVPCEPSHPLSEGDISKLTTTSSIAGEAALSDFCVALGEMDVVLKMEPGSELASLQIGKRRVLLMDIGTDNLNAVED